MFNLLTWLNWQVLFPKPDCLINPPFGICTDSQAKTVASLSELEILHVYSRFSQPLNSVFNCRDINDSVVRAHYDEGWWFVSGESGMAGIGHDYGGGAGQAVPAKTGNPL